MLIISLVRVKIFLHETTLLCHKDDYTFFIGLTRKITVEAEPAKDRDKQKNKNNEIIIFLQQSCN